jgi:hypothetical protein
MTFSRHSAPTRDDGFLEEAGRNDLKEEEEEEEGLGGGGYVNGFEFFIRYLCQVERGQK